MGRTKETLYFDKGGSDCTDATVAAAVVRAVDLGIKQIVVATTSGATALSLLSEVKRRGAKIQVVAVTYHAGYKTPDATTLPGDAAERLAAEGARIVSTTHALSGISRSFSSKSGGTSVPEVIAEAYRRVSQGFKVAIECSIMAADSGAVTTQSDIISIGGSGQGADTAIVLRTANMNRFFDMKVREIISMPR